MDCALAIIAGGRPVKQVCDVLGVARSNVAAKLARPSDWRDARAAVQTDDTALIAEIQQTVKDLPSYGYRRAWGLIRAERERCGDAPVNVKRIYRVMRVHGLLLQRKPRRPSIVRRHDGRVAVAKSNQRWCSDGFEFRCENGEPLRVTFALDCCDREAMSWVATTRGYTGNDVRDVMLAAVEHRFGNVDAAPAAIEWLSDNGSGYIAHETRAVATDIGLTPLTTPVCSPQSNGDGGELREDHEARLRRLHA